jgi:hypothetical protein
MLKAKLPKKADKRKQDAMYAVLIDDNLVGVHFVISRKRHKKLKNYVNDKEISMTQCFINFIDNLPA